MDIGRNVKEKTRLVQMEVLTEEFRGIFMDEMTAFREHVERVKILYKAMKDLKVQLLPTPVHYSNGFCRGLRLSK